MATSGQYDLLTRLVQEASQYNKIEDIEKLVEAGGDLTMVPIQPLYLALKLTSKEQVAAVLPKMSVEQRKLLLDLDLWSKDEIDVNQFCDWLEIYSLTQELNLSQEFSASEQFLLFVKSRINIHTFDPEDPQYPDHDYYFLTEDTQILFEYDEDFEQVNELKFFIKNLYAVLGVERAYTYLFKVLVDSQMQWQEQEYQFKKDRLRDFGFVDYFDALAFRAFYNSENQLNKYIKNKLPATGKLEVESKNQNLHATSIISFREGLDEIKSSLEKVSDDVRADYLKFNFIRLVNGTITLDDGLKAGSIGLNQIGKQTKQYMDLGFEYASELLRDNLGTKSLFDIFDFVDLYKIGGSLLSILRRSVKAQLQKLGFSEKNEAFLGEFFNRFLDGLFDSEPSLMTFDNVKARPINSVDEYRKLKSYTQFLVDLAPFIYKFYETLEHLKSEQVLNDQYYLNYKTEEIDFDAVIISSFINFSLGQYDKDKTSKMGVTIDELKKFISNHFTLESNNSVISAFEKSLQTELEKFSTQFGFDEVKYFNSYLYFILKHNLEGYDFNELEDEEFKHVGGPIILANA